MPADLSKYSSVLVAALLLWVIYRRVRRNFGRQPVSVARLALRAVLLAAIGALLVPLAFRSLPLAAAVLGGTAVGVALGAWGASRTRFERDGARLYYVPHTYSGLAVTALFLGRLAYRYVQGADIGVRPQPSDGLSQFTAMYSRSALTLGFFFVLVGYYVFYYSWMLYQARRLPPAGGLAGTPVPGDSSKPA